MNPREGTRAGLRSKASIDSGRPFEDNPESILRKHHKARKARQPVQVRDRLESQTRIQPGFLAKSLEASFAEQHRQVDYSTPYEYSDEASSPLRPETDPEQRFYYRWGYLPPLDSEAAAVIDAIIADPDMAKDYTRTSPDHQKFPEGLTFRNVFLKESTTLDLRADHVLLLKTQEFVPETTGERDSHGKLWVMDRAKCNEGSNEALFQRTLMMSLIARHRLIYDRDATQPHCLDFSVEETWSCPPMPTRAYWMGDKFLTQPKPDLAVSFRRQALIPDYLWNEMPNATKRLACFERADEVGGTRIFHFFTIEAKKAMISTDDTVGKRQSLNNASQALHNMFEFFRDAGPQYEEKFFTEVRFFSVVASTEGLTTSIHRATREPADGTDQGFIMKDRPDYPLRFEYREFSRIQKDNFDRKTVLEMIEKILLGYGAGELFFLLRDAAKVVMENLSNDLEGVKLRQNSDFYRYGQTSVKPGSRIQTPALSRAQSIQNIMSFNKPQSWAAMEPASQALSETNRSVDMLRSRTATPTQNRALKTTQASKEAVKRPRGESEDAVPARRTRRRKQS